MTTLVGNHDIPALKLRLAQARAIAVDTEFHTERTWQPELYLVQVAFDDGQSVILDPLVPGLLEALSDALRAVPAWLVHGGDQDIRLLTEALGGPPPEVWDTQIAAGLVMEHHPAGLAWLLRVRLGLHLAKKATLSDWSRRPLDHDQLRYAVEDVEPLHQLWESLLADADRLGRRDIVLQACEDARASALRPPDAGAGWRDLVGTGMVEPDEAAAIRDLLRWRDGVAQAENRPSRTLIGDAALKHIARLRPISTRDLDEQRRLPRSFVRTHAADIVAVIANCGEAPPLVKPASPAARRSALLRCLAEALGHAASFSGSLVLPTAVREDIALRQPIDREGLSSRLGAWRDGLLGDRLWSALQGDLRLTFDPRSGDIAVQD